MTIAIIEDEAAHRALLSSYIEAWSHTAELPVSVRSYETAEQFLFDWEDSQPEVVFVDIQMPGMNGMKLAKRLRAENGDIEIIFTTGLTDYLEEGYEVGALHYLIKPIRPEKVAACLDKAVSRRAPQNYCLVHTEEGSLQKLPLERINYVEAWKHKSIIGLAFGEPLSVRESLSELETVLTGEGFLKCHRSYLCRIEAIRQIEKETLTFDDGSCIPVSRRMYPEVNRRFIEHFRRI